MVKEILLSLMLISCASTGYYNNAAVSASYCRGTYKLTCEWSHK